MRNVLFRFFKEDEGQTTTEYILILAIVVILAMNFMGEFRPLFEDAMGRIGDALEASLEENLYRFSL